MTDLKPCPFCGENVNYTVNDGFVGWHKDSCFFQFLQNKDVDMTEDEIRKKFVEAWNKRTGVLDDTRNSGR